MDYGFRKSKYSKKSNNWQLPTQCCIFNLRWSVFPRISEKNSF